MFICDLVKELKTTYTRIFSIYEYVLPYRTFSIPWFYTLSLRLFLRSLPLLSSHSHDLSVRNPFSHGLFPWKNNNNTDRIRDPPSLAYLSLVLVMRRPSLTYHFWISHFRNGTVKRASEESPRANREKWGGHGFGWWTVYVAGEKRAVSDVFRTTQDGILFDLGNWGQQLDKYLLPFHFKTSGKRKGLVEEVGNSGSKIPHNWLSFKIGRE